MGVFSYLKDLLGKESESSNEDVYVVDPEFEEAKAAGDTSQSSSGSSTAAESKEGTESGSDEDRSESQEPASTAPEGLIKDKGTLAHLLEEEKNRSESSAAPRVGEEEIAHSFAAEDLAEDPEDGFEVPESGDSRREDSDSWGGQSEGSAAARVESGAEGVNGTPRAAVGDEGVVDTDSDEGVVLRIEDDSDGSAEGEVVVPEGSGSPVVESEGVAGGSGAVEGGADSVVKSENVNGGLDRVEDPVVKSGDETVEVKDIEPAEGEVSSSEAAEVKASVVEPVDEAEDTGTDLAAEESVGGVSSSEDVEVKAPAVENEDETGEVGGVEPVAEESAGEDSSSERVDDLVIKPVSGTVEPDRVDDLEVKSEDETVEPECVDDLEVKSGDETDSEPVVVEDSEDASAAEDGMDLVLESDGPHAETIGEDKTGSSSLDSDEQAVGLDNDESVGLGAVADEGEDFETLEAEETHSPVVEETHSPVVEAEDTHSPVVEETDSPVVEAEDTHSPVVEETHSPAVDVEETHSSVAEDAVEPGAGDAVSGGGVVSDGEETLDVKSEGQTLDLDVDDPAAEPSEGVSVADGSYGSVSVVPWSVYMARQSEEAGDAVDEDQEDADAGEDLAVADQSAVEEPAPIVGPENDADSVDEGDEQLIAADEESETDANSVDEGDEQLIEADEEPVEATVAPGLSLDEEDGVEVQDRDDVSFVSDTDEDTARATVDEDSDESVSEPSDLLDEDEGGEFVEAEDSDESEGSSSVVKSELEVDPSLIEGSDESETKKGESDGGLHISIPGF